MISKGIDDKKSLYPRENGALNCKQVQDTLLVTHFSCTINLQALFVLDQLVESTKPPHA